MKLETGVRTVAASPPRPDSDFDRDRADILALAEAAPTVDAMLAAVSGRMHEVMPFDATLWFGVDPATGLPSWPARIESIQAGHCETFWEREFVVDDALLYRDLASGPRVSGRLRAELDGLMGRSARYREFMRPQGFEDELRATLRSGDSTWGMIGFLRRGDSPEFTVEESRFVASLSKPLADAMRAKVLRVQATQGCLADGPGMLTFSAEGDLLSSNEAAWYWMEQLPNPRDVVEEVPVAVLSVMAHARAVARGMAKGSAELRVQSQSGRWLALRASLMNDPAGEVSSVAVLIEPANGGQLISILAEVYGFSKRELEVTQKLARGLPTAVIARELFLSEHTVRDHVKSVLAKVGVSSRGELVAELFFEHSNPDMHRRAVEV